VTAALAWGPWVCGVLAALCLVLAVLGFRGRRFIAASTAVLAGLLWSTLAALMVTLGAGLAGYRALTREEVALRVMVTPLAGQKFLADARFPEGRAETWEITGDQLYVDARILKWHGVANLLGLHTAYELDRIGGRYRDIAQERSAPRTIHSLGAPKSFDFFAWVERHTWMAPLVDAEYGSATFIDVDDIAAYEVRVSTTGLLIRKVE
jgi:hypothetical protein